MKYKAAIVGATGRTASAVGHFIGRNPYVEVVARTSRGEAGYFRLNIEKEDEVGGFCALEPDLIFITIDDEKAVRQYTEKLRERLPKAKIVELSTAYRTHPDFVYGLPEISGRREQIRAAGLVTNPGCYATSIILAAQPLLLAHPNEIEIITAVGISSHTGAGKKAENELRGQYEDNILSYASVGHKHLPEIRNEFNRLANRDMRVAFAPSAVWCSPAILNTLYIHTTRSFTTEQLRSLYLDLYGNERFVRVAEKEPGAKAVRGTNIAEVYPLWDSAAGVAIVRSTIDNLAKGAGGQAVQNANLMLGLNEYEGLL